VEGVAATHGLDACAVIAYLRQEPGADVLKALIELPTTFLAMHVCNLGEVYYDFFREDGLTAAQTAWINTLALPLNLHRDADDAFIQRVGVLKVEERISQIPPDLVVKLQTIDMAKIILPRIGRPNAAPTLCRNRISSFEQPSTSEAQWATTKSDGMWSFLNKTTCTSLVAAILASAARSS
jgi:hypothetical protein